VNASRLEDYIAANIRLESSFFPANFYLIDTRVGIKSHIDAVNATSGVAMKIFHRATRRLPWESALYSVHDEIEC